MKTEKEIMLAGEMYDPEDAELVAERKTARLLFQQYNATTEHDLEERKQILTELMGQNGDNVNIQPPFYCDYGYNIYLGKNCFFNFDCVILDVCKVTIGDNLMAAPKVQIYTATHPLDPVKRNSGRELGAEIKIGNNVWLGGGCIICPGVTIGDNSTIGAGSVVTRDIPANVFAAGNPCKVVKEID
ncbi:sugar O-acetyltransferase [Chondrinema litorale]|uniref:sugar O-acetyltransferase n=1 Tax=Chondrinema litorale TaxID=2994555 RepID=UPI002543A13D|nr:sugar O-acetyltransferase [Chondrinema litorale]UZR94498.1 sugar O-acetyltransferase [Chondrinema litorale]